MDAGVARRLVRKWILVGCVFLLLCTILPWLIPEAEIDSLKSAKVNYAIPAIQEIIDFDQNTYQESFTRPLFWKERRPHETEPEGEKVVEDAKGEDQEISFLGIMLIGDVRKVLLANAGETLTLEEGGEISGWVVRELSANSVVLGKDHEELILPAATEYPETIELRRVVE